MNFSFLFLLVILVSSCATLRLDADTEAQVLTHLLEHRFKIRITDPDPTPYKLAFYEKESLLKRTVHCDWDKKFEIHRCYYTQILSEAPYYYRMFYFGLKDKNNFSGLDTIEICQEKTKELTYFSPECPLNYHR
jgi:hypothetical protein